MFVSCMSFSREMDGYFLSNIEKKESQTYQDKGPGKMLTNSTVTIKNCYFSIGLKGAKQVARVPQSWLDLSYLPLSFPLSNIM